MSVGGREGREGGGRRERGNECKRDSVVYTGVLHS
jgi:hypothetical protein